MPTSGSRDRAARRRRTLLQRGRHQGLPGGDARARVSKLAWNVAAPARCSKPVIAAGRGYCFGVGFELSLACDFRLATETTLYALPEQKLGQIPGSGGSARLQKMVGITRTKDIVMRSRRITGRRPTSGAWPPTACPTPSSKRATDALVSECALLADRAAHRQEAAQRHRRLPAVRLAIELEGHCYSRLRSSEDFREGVEAFHSKRKPAFVGR
jgi:2-oxoglutaroyl-CoA hydrolase